tara:strand:- start:198 stop:815 length:618 start_codon:yes stop_codon:yes gene_type:complete
MQNQNLLKLNKNKTLLHFLQMPLHLQLQPLLYPIFILDLHTMLASTLDTCTQRTLDTILDTMTDTRLARAEDGLTDTRLARAEDSLMARDMGSCLDISLDSLVKLKSLLKLKKSKKSLLKLNKPDVGCWLMLVEMLVRRVKQKERRRTQARVVQMRKQAKIQLPDNMVTLDKGTKAWCPKRDAGNDLQKINKIGHIVQTTICDRL